MRRRSVSLSILAATALVSVPILLLAQSDEADSQAPSARITLLESGEIQISGDADSSARFTLLESRQLQISGNFVIELPGGNDWSSASVGGRPVAEGDVFTLHEMQIASNSFVVNAEDATLTIGNPVRIQAPKAVIGSR